MYGESSPQTVLTKPLRGTLPKYLSGLRAMYVSVGLVFWSVNVYVPSLLGSSVKVPYWAFRTKNNLRLFVGEVAFEVGSIRAKRTPATIMTSPRMRRAVRLPVLRGNFFLAIYILYRF